MFRTYYSIWIMLVMLFTLNSSAVGMEQEPLELITAQEAASPDLTLGHFEAGRDLEEGPIVDVVIPEYGKAYKPPIQVKVKFVPKDGNEIDLSTLRIEYLKFLTIDLTPRVKGYTTKDGINIPEAKLPSGIHTIRVTIGDVKGAVTRQVFTLEVL